MLVQTLDAIKLFSNNANASFVNYEGEGYIDLEDNELNESNSDVNDAVLEPSTKKNVAITALQKSRAIRSNKQVFK